MQSLWPQPPCRNRLSGPQPPGLVAPPAPEPPTVSPTSGGASQTLQRPYHLEGLTSWTLPKAAWFLSETLLQLTQTGLQQVMVEAEGRSGGWGPARAPSARESAAAGPRPQACPPVGAAPGPHAQCRPPGAARPGLCGVKLQEVKR